tara:strand:- start:3639 stop:4274 length:636 start_codon:yes stop_codon:yes gene_type:complete
MLTAMGIGAIGKVAGGLVEGIGGMIGQRKRKKEQRNARDAYDKRLNQFESLDSSNLAGDLSNPYEDLTVNTQAADFAGQQQQQGLANTMSGMSGAAGGSGIAALAQAMANQQGMQAQQTSAGIAQQEQANQQAFMGQEVANQSAEIAGASSARNLQYDKTSALAQAAASRAGAADKAVNDARAAMIGGIGDVVGGVSELALGGFDGVKKPK